MLAAQPGRGGHPFVASRIAASPELRRQIETARSLGISLKRLCGWVPRKITKTVTEPDGTAVATTVEEVEWDEQERAWMLGLGFLEDTSCHRCGTWLAESTDPGNDPDRPDAHHHYVAEPPVECHSCKVLVRSQRAWDKNHEGAAEYTIHTAALVPHTPRRRIGPKGRVRRRD